MLQRQTISMPLAQGVDTKTDSKQVVAGNLLELENGVFTKLKSIRKRDGNVALGQGLLNSPGSTLTSGIGLATYGNELLEADGERLYSYDENNAAWVDKSRYVPVFVTQSSVCKDSYVQTAPDGATHPAGLQLYAWQDSLTPNSLRYAVIDSNTQQTIVSSALLSVNAQKPRVLINDTHFLIYFVDTAGVALKLATVSIQNPTIAPTIYQLTAYSASDNALSATHPNYDAEVIQSQPQYNYSYLCVAFSNAVGGITVRTYDIGLMTTVIDQTTIADPARSICVFTANTNVPGSAAPTVIYSTDNGIAPYTTDIKFVSYNSSLSMIGLGTIASGLNYTDARAITAANNDPAGGIGFDVFYATCDTYPSKTMKVVVDGSYLSSTPVVWQRRVAPVGRAFNYDGKIYLPTVFFYPGQTQSLLNSVLTSSGTIPLQSLYFLMDGDANIVAKAFDLSLAANAQVAYTPPTLGTVDTWTASTGKVVLTSASDLANFVVGMPIQSRTNGVLDGQLFVGAAYVVATSSIDNSVTLSNTPGGPAGQGLDSWLVHQGSTLSTITDQALSGVLLPNASNVSTSVFRYALLDQVLIQGSITATQTNVSQVTFDLVAPLYALNHETLASDLHLTGGFLQMYDGINVVEHNFHIEPIFEINQTYASNGHLSAGKYFYTVCYEWVDNQGNIHQSSPAPYQNVTVANDARVSLKIAYLNQTSKKGIRPVQIVVYRTQHDGKILYRVSSLTSPSLNNADGEYLYFVDGLSDADLAIQPKLYTQELSTDAVPEVVNSPAPPTGLVQLHRNRLWVVDSTRPLDVWYSKLTSPATPVAFNDGFIKYIDPRGGPVTALATIDDKLLVFKAGLIFFIVGQGPDNTGQNNDLSDSILVTSDAGCIDPRSVVASPVGILFKSRKGIYLIDRSLQVQYIGAAVEAYNNEIITSSVLVANTNQVRFTLESGRTLIFDYYVQQWGTFTNQNAIDSLIWQGSATMLRANGQTLVETPGVYTDAGQPISLRLVTSWLSFANVQGFQRIRRMLVLGGQESPRPLKIDVAVDFDDTIVQSMSVIPTPPPAYGNASPYGSGSFGGTYQLYQWRIDLARQKCQAVKFTFEDVPSVTAAGEALGLTSLAFEVGAKQGLNKVPASQTVS